ncbi:MAG: hypothetical protein KME19_10415 [Microcoleus vaginatus WJT46-NPBG5]|jgi:hypothetical protein|nr:hypothetical protein [Microcoleus vaginatus WJT46-NPBG5]
MSQDQTPVPRLDLAPKLKRPLSLWNPLDYLRLRYWVFFFPQALKWYGAIFGNKAAAAFALVRSLPYAAELLTLAETLTAFYSIESLEDLLLIELPNPPNEPLLRPATWKAIASLRRVAEDFRAVVGSVSRSTRSFALNRALGELKSILDTGDCLPEAERKLILGIAEVLQELLLKVATEVGEISITEPVRNPYVVGNLVQRRLFFGREDVIRQLEELWVLGNQVQSVVLFGHRRMGKTSILKNVANCLGSGIKVAYINLLNLGDISQGVGEVLIAICDEISRTVNLAPPADADLLNLPTRTFERYLKQVEANLTGSLIIALDEFEKIEELIEAGKISKDFMDFLRGMVQMSPRIAFAFAGLHTLEEMTADYFQPFFASVIPIKVGFMERATTGYLLANPDEDFPLDYKLEALDLIYELTAGQPYLVWLIGFGLVRRYNDQVFEIAHPREPVFTVDDVETVINDPEFFQRGRYYFTGVWGQAAQGAVHQQAIIKALALHPEGLSVEALAETAGIDETTLGEALKTLTRHDVVEEKESRWRIIVELFRRWVLNHA